MLPFIYLAFLYSLYISHLFKGKIMNTSYIPTAYTYINIFIGIHQTVSYVAEKNTILPDSL